MKIGDKLVIKSSGLFGVLSGIIYDPYKKKTTLFVRECLTDNEHYLSYSDVITKKRYHEMIDGGIENEITRQVQKATNYIKGR